MANKIQILRGLEANRLSITPAIGELLYTTDTQNLYVGDGSTAGGVLLTGAGGTGDMSKSVYDTNNNGIVDNSEDSALLEGNNSAYHLDRANHTGTQTLSTISDAGTAASKDVGTSAGQVPVLDGSGKLSTSVLPALAITSVFTAADETAQLALTVQEGDIVIRTDESKTYIHNGGVSGTMADFSEILSPTDAVLSVNGQTGVVTLTTDNINEGSTNLYYTNTRVQSYLDSIGNLTSSSTIDGGTF